MNPQLSEYIHIEKIEGNGHYFVLDPDIPSWAIINKDGVEVLKLCDGKSDQKLIAQLALEKLNLENNKQSKEVIESFIQSMRENQILNGKRGETAGDNSFRGVALEITKSCNLNCKHCYLSAGEKSENELTLKEIQNLLNEIKENGGVSVAVGGGEPLMRKDCMKIIKHALSLDLLVSIGTNGTLINKNLASELSELGIKVQISLDGATAPTHDRIRGKGAFEKTIRGIDNLIGEGMANNLVIAFTPMKPNIHELNDIIDFAMDRDIPVVQFPPLTSSGRAKEIWNKLRLSSDEMFHFWELVSRKSKELRGRLDLLSDCFSIDINNIGKPHRCSIGTQFRIAPDGSVYPCQCFHFGESYKLGNIREQGINAIVRGSRIKAIKDKCFTRPTLIPECKECKWVNFCGAGCMGNVFENYGTIYKPESCEVRKKWVEKLFDDRFVGIQV